MNDAADVQLFIFTQIIKMGNCKNNPVNYNTNKNPLGHKHAIKFSTSHESVVLLVLVWDTIRQSCVERNDTHPLKNWDLERLPACSSWWNSWPICSRVIWLLSSVDSTPTRTKTYSIVACSSSSTHCMASCTRTYPMMWRSKNVIAMCDKRMRSTL